MTRPGTTGISPGSLPPVVFALLILNGLVFALQQAPGFARPLILLFGLWPATAENSPFAIWQVVTYSFLHGGLPHLFFNMFALWMFGRNIEWLMGSRRFLVYYLACVVGAAVVQLIVASTQTSIYPTIGASGGVFGILLAFGMAFPNRMIVLLIPPIPMKAKYFVILYGLLELYFGMTGIAPGVAHFAHLGGMLFGYLLIQYWRRQRRQ